MAYVSFPPGWLSGLWKSDPAPDEAPGSATCAPAPVHVEDRYGLARLSECLPREIGGMISHKSLSESVYGQLANTRRMRPENDKVDPLETARSRLDLISLRLRTEINDLLKALPGLRTTRHDGVVFTHFVRNGELVVFKEEEGLFPSDALIINLRLCI